MLRSGKLIVQCGNKADIPLGKQEKRNQEQNSRNKQQHNGQPEPFRIIAMQPIGGIASRTQQQTHRYTEPYWSLFPHFSRPLCCMPDHARMHQ